MKTTKIMKISTKQVVSTLTGVMVIAGIITFSLMNKTHTDGDLISRLFLVFFGLIITAQIIPGLILFGAMLKGAFSSSRKQQEVPK